LVFVILALVTGLLSSCGERFAAREKARFASPPPPGAPAAESAPSPGVSDEVSLTGGTLADKASTAPADRKIITTGSLTLEVLDLDKALSELKALVGRHGGFISQSSISVEDNWRSGTVTVRVPAAHFEQVHDGARALGVVKHDEQQGEDVTEQWQDLEARLRIRRQEEESLLELMKKQGRLADLLQVEKRLWEVREQIEQAEGRLRYLKDRVDLATLTVSLSQQIPASVSTGGRWNLGYHLWQAIVALNRLVQGIIIGLQYLVITGLPIWLPLVLIIWWLRRRLRAARLRRQQPPPPPPAPAG
jgi:hypothetical protein